MLLEDPSDPRVRFILRSADDPLADDAPNVMRNLAAARKSISPTYVYDSTGTDYFERQCATPEYYLRRSETWLLERYAGEILALCGFLPIVELGAGTAQKTQILLAEYSKHGVRCDYFPIDVDVVTLHMAARRLIQRFPLVFVHCLGATYERALLEVPRGPTSSLFLFLGSSLGNMEPPAIDVLLSQVFRSAAPGDFLLLGVDLHKDCRIIDAAYNDAAGWGARSTLNMLDHLNRRYDGDFVAARFGYRSKYEPLLRRNEVRIQSLVDQTVTLRALNFTTFFAAAELIDAEVMLKFDPVELTALLQRAGFSPVRSWIEPRFRYGLFLVRRR